MLFNLLPDNLFNIFASNNTNRNIYFKTLMILFEEYRNKSDILTREECSTLIIEKFENELFSFKDEYELEEGVTNNEIEYSNKILTNLIRTGWICEEHDTQRMIREITMPTYSSEILEAFYKIIHPNEEETEHYIFDIYSNLNSVLNEEPSVKYSCLLNAESKAKSLRRNLQDILHNIKSLYDVLMNTQILSGVMEEHFNNYAVQIVDKSYHRLKTEDNLYKYRQRIIQMINEARFRDELQEQIIDFAIGRQRFSSREEAYEFVRDAIDSIKSVFDNIENNIRNIDIRHRRYVNTAVTRVQYLQRRDKDLKGNLIRVLNAISKNDSIIEEVSKEVKIKDNRVFDIERSFRRPPEKRNSNKDVEPIRRPRQVDIEDIKSKIVTNKYKAKDIEEFVSNLLSKNVNEVSAMDIKDDDTFYKVIMTYDYGIKTNNKGFRVKLDKDKTIFKGSYRLSNFIISTDKGKKK